MLCEVEDLDLTRKFLYVDVLCQTVGLCVQLLTVVCARTDI